MTIVFLLLVLMSVPLSCEGEESLSLFQKCVLCTEANKYFEFDITRFETNCTVINFCKNYSSQAMGSVIISSKSKCNIFNIFTPSPSSVHPNCKPTGIFSDPQFSSNSSEPSTASPCNSDAVFVIVIEGIFIAGLLILVFHLIRRPTKNPRNDKWNRGGVNNCRMNHVNPSTIV